MSFGARYDFKGGDIIETLKNLHKKFEDDLVEASRVLPCPGKPSTCVHWTPTSVF